MHRRVCALVSAILLVASMTSSVHAWSRDPSTNDPVAVAAGDQGGPRVLADGAGNYFVVWHDARSGNFDIYLQKYDRNGVAQWATNGVAIYTQSATQTYPQMVLDGAGGVIVAWTDLRNVFDFDIYAQRVNASGTPQWAVGGVPVCTATNNQWHLEIAPDGANGMLATWTDFRSGGESDVYVQRVDGSGNRLWTTNGVAIATTTSREENPFVVSDGGGGAYVCWMGWTGTTRVQRVNAAGAAQWSGGGISLNFDAGVPWYPRLTTDGTGGCIVAWFTSGSNSEIEGVRIQRFNALGTPQWTAGGVRLTQYVGGVVPTYTYLDLVPDGAGGVFVAWSDERDQANTQGNVYAQKVNASGVRQWTNNGVPVCTATYDQEGYYHPVVPDGNGGAIIAWEDQREFGLLAVYAQRISASGAPQWTPSGLLVSTAGGAQAHPHMAADGRGGGVVVWDDMRTGNLDVRAQRLDFLGQFGDPAPEIVSIKDLPNDQGGHVRIKWNRSYRDTLPSQFVTEYGIWRQVTEASANASLARRVRVHEPGKLERGAIRADRSAAQVTWWECVGTSLARAEPWYTFVAETFQDSTSAGNPLTTFMVDAHDPYANGWWSSFPATGYSVDNLPPSIPGGFTAVYQGGATQLAWDANLESDLGGYRVYRGATPDFEPSPANRIATVGTTSHSDPTGGGFYKLSAVDIHGNESAFATVTGSTGVGDVAPAELSLAPPSPNPAPVSAAFHYVLPREGVAALSVLDAQGRLVRRLMTGVQPAGERMVRWDLRDENGSRVSGGLYWVRLEADGRQIVRRLVALR